MKLERYEPLLASADVLKFKFNSLGPKGRILKVVQFRKTNDPGVHYLAFGNLLPDGSIDHHSIDDNRDRNKILTTVAVAIYKFTARYPDKLVFFTGSTDGRTRLYRMALTIHFQKLSMDFDIYGVNLKEEDHLIEPFEKGKDYYGFAVKRKIN
jgi:hypothetical protein